VNEIVCSEQRRLQHNYSTTDKIYWIWWIQV